MNKNQKNKLRMYRAVESVMGNSNASWTGLPALGTAFTAFSEKLNQLETLRYSQAFITTGVGIVKSEKRKEIAQLVIPISNGIKAFATSTKNIELREMLRFSPSDFKYKSDLRVVLLIDTVIEQASVHLTELGDFGVTQQKLDELIATRKDLKILMSSPRVAIIDRKQVTNRIRSTVNEIDRLLKSQMDMLISILKVQDLAFFTKYKSTRIIISLKRHTTGEIDIQFDDSSTEDDVDSD